MHPCPLRYAKNERAASFRPVACDVTWTVGVNRVIFSVIPRLHDEAGSTSWLYERTTSQLVERWTSARRALDKQLRECLQYYIIQVTR